MSLSTNLVKTAFSIIEKYGNNIVITNTTSDETYNPQTGKFGSIVEISYNKKAYEVPITNSVLEKSGIDASLWGTIKGLYVIVEDTDITDINNNWSINGKKVTKVTKVTAQDTKIIVNIYVG